MYIAFSFILTAAVGHSVNDPISVPADEAVAVKKGNTRIDFEHFAPDPAMFDIDDELVMVSAKINIEDFKILKVLGRGTYGKVMLVQHKEEGTLYALKAIQKNKVIKTSQIEHTKSERRILEKMEHPFIVTLRYAFQTKSRLYMVFDFVSGGELFQHLKNDEYFSEARTKFYAAEILLALEFLHKKNIMYRDLKPENVLLDTDGHVKITDFGLAKELSSTSQTSTFCGTDEYLAPEIILNVPYNESVDIWALGVLIYEMLTGWAPWQERNRKKLFDNILYNPLDLSHPNFSASARDLLKRMLEKIPEDRLKLPAEIKKHEFFAGIDFNKLYIKAIKPTFVPKIVSFLHATRS